MKFTFAGFGGGGSGGPSYSLPFGAELVPLGYFFAAHGDARSLAVTSNGLYSQIAVPAPGRLLRIGWNTDVGDITSKLELWKGVTPVDIFFLTGGSGSNVLGGVPVLAGDKISLLYAAGAAPITGTFDIFIEP